MRQHYRFCLPQSKSPTYDQLGKHLSAEGWRHTRFKSLADFGVQHFQCDTRATEQLEFKHLLAQLVNEYCPEVMPQTYCINDHNWPFILSTLSEQNYGANEPWILKPSTLNNGQHIHIFQQNDEIEAHYLGRNRLGGEQVLQRYIPNPHLLKGHKYSIRMFVIMTNHRGVYIYPNGYINVSLSPYIPNDFKDLSRHLTNEHLKDHESNVVQIPTQRLSVFHLFYPQIKNILDRVFDALHNKHPQAFQSNKQATFALFGFDFMANENLEISLLEANHGPCFPTEADHPLQSYLYDDFWTAFIHDFVMPMAKSLHSTQAEYFETIEGC